MRQPDLWQQYEQANSSPPFVNDPRRLSQIENSLRSMFPAELKESNGDTSSFVLKIWRYVEQLYPQRISFSTNELYILLLMLIRFSSLPMLSWKRVLMPAVGNVKNDNDLVSNRFRLIVRGDEVVISPIDDSDWQRIRNNISTRYKNIFHDLERLFIRLIERTYVSIIQDFSAKETEDALREALNSFRLPEP